MKTETEAKCAVPDVEAVAARLEDLGRRILPWDFEVNVLWDTPEGRLRGAGELLRLRTTSQGAVLTHKKPAPTVERVKSMAEEETAVADACAMSAILRGIGLVSVWRYEKFRSVWQVRTPHGHAGVCLDIVPYGHFVEVEAEPASIDAVFALLGLVPGPEATRTYRDLFRDWLSRRGLPEDQPMVFPPREVALWARRLGVPSLPYHGAEGDALFLQEDM